MKKFVLCGIINGKKFWFKEKIGYVKGNFFPVCKNASEAREHFQFSPFYAPKKFILLCTKWWVEPKSNSQFENYTPYLESAAYN